MSDDCKKVWSLQASGLRFWLPPHPPSKQTSHQVFFQEEETCNTLWGSGSRFWLPLQPPSKKMSYQIAVKDMITKQLTLSFRFTLLAATPPVFETDVISDSCKRYDNKTTYFELWVRTSGWCWTHLRNRHHRDIRFFSKERKQRNTLWGSGSCFWLPLHPSSKQMSY
jgi:hypothetical protein